MKELIQNQYYWVLEDFNIPFNINKDIFNKLKYCRLAYRITEYGCDRFYFKNKASIQLLAIFEYEVHNLVYDTLDDFLVYLVHRINEIKHSIMQDIKVDDYVLQNIENSKINFPEKWI